MAVLESNLVSKKQEFMIPLISLWVVVKPLVALVTQRP